MPHYKSISWNINGIRSAAKKGFLAWLERESPDFLSLQEIKAHPKQLTESLLQPAGYQAFWCPAQKAGYSGVVIYSKHNPLQVIKGMGHSEFDAEGRVLALQFPEFWLINSYFPHSRRDLSRLDFKLAFNNAFMTFCHSLKQACDLPFIVCGDFNTAHTHLDLTNDRANRKNAGFLPQEREWLDQFLGWGMVDIFRQTHPDEKGHYTWWSQRKGVRERNIGWRIDYHMVATSLAKRVTAAYHLSDVYGSDHCPVGIEFEL